MTFKAGKNSVGNMDINEVYVNDFIGATNNLTREHLLHFSRLMLHGVHSIYPPQNITNHPGGESIPKNKLDKGEGEWGFTKEILGCIFDGKEFTVQLPAEKQKPYSN